MLVLKPIGERVARYYLGQGPGEWIGRGAGRLGLDGGVEAQVLSSVLRGCDPATGRFLPRVRSPRRRAGWDLVFAAPKSLSLLSALSLTDRQTHRAISCAHLDAIRGVVDHFQEGSGKDIIAAAFGHTTNAGGEPHVHTHVLVANLAPCADGWSALGAWLPRDELAAIYHLGLRNHLERAGLRLDWRIRPNGLPDVAAVPRAAVRAASTRSHESKMGQAWGGRKGPARNWAGAARDAGWSESRAIQLAGGSVDRTPPATSSLDVRVSSRLLARSSTFTKRDVLVALAAASPAGFDAGAASSWADAFCGGAFPAGSGPGDQRWTTQAALDADRRLAELVGRRMGRALGREGPSVADGTMESVARGDPSLSAESLAAVRSLAGAEPVMVMTADPGSSHFVSHATVLGACAAVWESEGKRVAVAPRSADGASRWGALTGIERFQPSRRPDVLLVDQAERRSPGELMALLSSAPDAKWVFIEGGTLPRGRVDASVGYRTLASNIARVDSGPAPEWRVTDQHNCASTSAGLAVGRLMDDWAGRIGFSGSGDPVMVGLGVPETLALNDAARRHLVETGQVDGPAVSSRGRLFQAGDRVVAIRGAGAGLPCGTVGSVVEVDTKKRSAMITWPDRASEMRRDALATIGHAYAATPRLAARMDGPLLVLGRSEGMGLARSRIAAEVSVERAAPALGTGRRVDPIARGIC